jgi:hypothetical protein
LGVGVDTYENDKQKKKGFGTVAFHSKNSGLKRIRQACVFKVVKYNQTVAR